VPVLPLIDLLILVGWTSLMAGAALRILVVATRYKPTILGFTSSDLMMIAGICFLFALTLAARTWVKLNEPRGLSLGRRAVEARDRRRREALFAQAGAEPEPDEAELPPVAPPPGAARADRR
jgi:hypothetical protein